MRNVHGQVPSLYSGYINDNLARDVSKGYLLNFIKTKKISNEKVLGFVHVPGGAPCRRVFQKH